jgi:hypothetical protein
VGAEVRSLHMQGPTGAGGGVTRSLATDPHGKSLSAWMLTIEFPGHNEEQTP